MPLADIEQVPGKVWNSLATGAGPWRTPVLATAGPQDGGDARIVVLRAVSTAERDLVFFTDRRSRKYRQLENHPAACLLVYDEAQGVQVRLYGVVTREASEEMLDQWWRNLAAHQRSHYAADASVPQTAGNGKGRENFTAFHVRIHRFHCLWIHDDGNEAAEFEWRDGRWPGRFCRP
ncbi:MAG TPA: pyridoxamine 5'-phosphate oxidase family protein [Gammaproteobacteria bacterium]